jgi:hypothetical protein
MSEWWTYSLSDFLMFSLRTYYRQFELLNRELWPLHLLTLGAGALATQAMLWPAPAQHRKVFVLLGVAWLWVAWAYHAERYADINTGAPYFAAAFCAQGLLLAWVGLRRRAASALVADSIPGRLALAIVMAAVVVFPLLAPLSGLSWWQAQVFGIAPDPTCAATLGALLFWRAPWFLWVVPLLWSAASGATLMALHASPAWLLPALALVAAGLRLAGWSRRT